jgi:hypothetical protein
LSAKLSGLVGQWQKRTASDARKSLSSNGWSAFRPAIHLNHMHFAKHLCHESFIDIFRENIGWIFGSQNFVELNSARPDNFLNPQICCVKVPDFAHSSAASNAYCGCGISPDSESVVIT